jgi:hypothetical protein
MPQTTTTKLPTNRRRSLGAKRPMAHAHGKYTGVPTSAPGPRIVKIFELAFPLEVTPLPWPHFVVSSAPLSPIITVHMESREMLGVTAKLR